MLRHLAKSVSVFEGLRDKCFSEVQVSYFCKLLHLSKQTPHLVLGLENTSLSISGKAPAAVSVHKRWKGYRPGPKMPPTKPNFDYSGDLETVLPPVDLNTPRLEYKDCQELDAADEITKRVLSLKFAPSAEVLKFRLDEMIKKVQKHELDFSSRQVIIARKTVEIRNAMRHCMNFPQDKVSKSKLINKIQKRRKQIKLLRNEDYPLYKKLTQFLNIDYVPVYRHRKPTKRERRVNEVVEKAQALRQQKMEELRIALQEERKSFDLEKDLLLKEIDEELRAIAMEEEQMMDELEEYLVSTPLVNKPHVSDKLKDIQ